MRRGQEPTVRVGIVEGAAMVRGTLYGSYTSDGRRPVTGAFDAVVESGAVVVRDAGGEELARSPSVRFTGQPGATFSLFDVTIGVSFHWERREEQRFKGALVLSAGEEAMITVINELGAEEYLKSVISSEMNAASPEELLKTHAILSRSWLMAALAPSRRDGAPSGARPGAGGSGGEVVVWYERSSHREFDVCADDHCQRYHGVGRITGTAAEAAVDATRGTVLTHEGEICDARYSKACGGLTEEFGTAWDEVDVPYLRSVSDAAIDHPPILSEADAARWVLSSPEAYCHTADRKLLERILPSFDTETEVFFRWSVQYPPGALEELLREKSGIDFGTLQEIVPLDRGPSGRIKRLRLVGSKAGVVVGKELEIRRWLSPSHLYSSAFIVSADGERGKLRGFTLRGAGWGHGVGLCQIGAAVMATKGFSAPRILGHYFRGVELSRIY